jgi:hypothetical protein
MPLDTKLSEWIYHARLEALGKNIGQKVLVTYIVDHKEQTVEWILNPLSWRGINIGSIRPWESAYFPFIWHECMVKSVTLEWKKLYEIDDQEVLDFFTQYRGSSVNHPEVNRQLNMISTRIFGDFFHPIGLLK